MEKTELSAIGEESERVARAPTPLDDPRNGTTTPANAKPGLVIDENRQQTAIGSAPDPPGLDHFAGCGATGETRLDIIATLPVSRVGIPETRYIVEHRIEKRLGGGGIVRRLSQSQDVAA